jgi:hypothetical protein
VWSVGDMLLDPARDYISIEVVDARGGYLTAVPAASSLLERADRLARDHDRDVDAVRRLVALYNRAQTSSTIDALITKDLLMRLLSRRSSIWQVSGRAG